VGWDNVVGIATRYGVDGPGIESRWGQDFPQSSRPDLGTTEPHTMGTLSLSPGGGGVKGPVRGLANHSI
jgi:hypothetical protein